MTDASTGDPRCHQHWCTITWPRHQADLHVQVQHVLLVHEVDAGADLAHEDGARLLRQDVVVLNDTIEQLSALYSAGRRRTLSNSYLPARKGKETEF